MKPKIVKSLLLDRDGVINKLIQNNSGLISPQSVRDFTFKKGSKEAIMKARDLGSSIFVVSNQPDVSKKWRKLDKDRLKDINNKLNNIGIEKTFNCTHGPIGSQKSSTYTGENGEIITCGCRKPQPGLIHKWYNEEDVKPENTVFVGDNKTDIMAAKKFEENTGTEFSSKIKIGESQGLCDKNMESLKQVVKSEIK